MHALRDPTLECMAAALHYTLLSALPSVLETGCHLLELDAKPLWSCHAVSNTVLRVADDVHACISFMTSHVILMASTTSAQCMSPYRALASPVLSNKVHLQANLSFQNETRTRLLSWSTLHILTLPQSLWLTLLLPI
jgi:hypothetical protein